MNLIPNHTLESSCLTLTTNEESTMSSDNTKPGKEESVQPYIEGGGSDDYPPSL